MKRRAIFLPLLIIFVLMEIGCAKPSMVLPEHIQSISAPIFKNHTRKYGIEAEITAAITSELAQSGRVAVVPSGQADAQLLGKVLEYRVAPVSFDRKDFVTQYQLIVVISFMLKDLRRDQVLWEEAHFQSEAYYYLGRTYPSTEAAERQAFEEILEDLSERAVSRIYYGF